MQAASYEVVEGRLHITNADNAVILTFEVQVAPSLTGILWRATNYNNGQEAVVNVLDGSEITAIFNEDGTLSGSAGCNNYVAGYTVDGNQITIEQAASTMMMCAEPEGVMEQEAAYLMALTTAATFSIQGNVLEMRTAEDAMVARYESAGPASEIAPTEEVTGTEEITGTEEVTATEGTTATEESGAAPNIVGVTWQWVQSAYGDDTTLTVDDPTKYTMTLQADGTVALQVDCNAGGGSYTLDGSVISFDVAIMTRMACPEETLSDTFIQELNAAATFVMDGEELVLNLFADAGNMHFSPAP
jgi:heat shock protein HslJ